MTSLCFNLLDNFVMCVWLYNPYQHYVYFKAVKYI